MTAEEEAEIRQEIQEGTNKDGITRVAVMIEGRIKVVRVRSNEDLELIEELGGDVLELQ